MTVIQGIRTALVVILLAGATGAGAAEKPLTAAKVEHWLTAQADIAAWAEKNHLDEEPVADAEDAPFDPESAASAIASPETFSVEALFEKAEADMKASVEAAGLSSELTTLVKRHGYSSVDEWIAISIQIFKASTAAQMAEDSAQMIEMRTQLAAVDKDPHLLADQKKMVKEMLQNALDSMVAMRNSASAADVAAVAPYLDRLEAVFESESGDENTD